MYFFIFYFFVQEKQHLCVIEVYSCFLQRKRKMLKTCEDFMYQMLL